MSGARPTHPPVAALKGQLYTAQGTSGSAWHRRARGVTFPNISSQRNASWLDSVFLVRHERDFVSSPSIEDGPLTRGPTNGEAGRYVLR